MKKTVLVTGTSSGIGRSTALEFARRGWNVVATMRTPSQEKGLGTIPGIALAPLDVTDAASIEAAIRLAVDRFGGLDAVINNAGYGLVGPFEATSPEQVLAQFDTNVFGLLNVSRAALPHLRERKGTLVNVTSMGGRLTFPLHSVYHASKFAVEGFSEALAQEVRGTGVKVRVVEPGAIRTDFYSRSAQLALPLREDLSDYRVYTANVLANTTAVSERGSFPEAVARTIVRATESKGGRLRYAVGPDARALLWIRRFLPSCVYGFVVRAAVERKHPKPLDLEALA